MSFRISRTASIPIPHIPNHIIFIVIHPRYITKKKRFLLTSEMDYDPLKYPNEIIEKDGVKC